MLHYSYMIIDAAVMGEDFRPTFDFLKSCGYEGVELNLTPFLLERLDQVEKALESSGLVMPSFLTGAVYNEGLCLSSPDADIRRRTVERLQRYVDLGQRFNALLVVGLLQGLRSDESDADVANKRIAAGLREVGLTAGDKGVDIVIEPINHLQVGFNNSVAEVQQLIAAIGVPAFKPMVDTIHMNIEETSLTEPIYSCGDQLRHVHLCESNGGLLGSGHIDFAAVLQALDAINYEGFASVKIYRQSSLLLGASSALEYLS